MTPAATMPDEHGRPRSWCVADPEHPDFRPLRQHLGLNCAFDDDHHAACPMDDWMWMYRQDGYEFYKHVVTREYLRLPACDGSHS